MRILVWLVRGFLFFTLFAFALNNEAPVTVHWFFGYQWRAPLVIVVLAALAVGAALGVAGMLPGWWRGRLSSRQKPAAAPAVAGSARPAPSAAASLPPEPALEHPPREGL